MRTLTALLDCWSRQQPDATLFTFGDPRGKEAERYTYRQFATRSAALAEHLRRHGLKHGERALLLHPPGLELMVALIACCRLGALPTVAPISATTGWRSTATRARIAAMVADCAPSLALACESQVAAIESGDEAPGGLPVVATDGPMPEARHWQDEPHDIALLQYTSGSTRNPRGVCVTHRNIIANAQALLDHRPVGVTWLPQFHDMGLIGYGMFPIVMGGCSHGIAPDHFLRRPAIWFRMMSHYRATFCSAPNFGFDHCLRPDRITDADLEGVDLSSLRVLTNGAEPVSPALCRRFAERFAPFGLRRDVLIAAYGLAEATLAVSSGGHGGRVFDANRLAHGVATTDVPAEGRAIELASCGQVLPSVDLTILSPTSGTSCRAGEVGEIVLTGESITPGHWSGGSMPSREGPLETGDLGFELDGELFVCGRSSDVIIRNGENFHPQDIEAAALAADADIRRCAALQSEEGEVVLLVEPAIHNTLPDADALANRVSKATGLVPDRVVVAAKRSIRYTTSGKLARGLTRQHLAEGKIRCLTDTCVAIAPDSEDDSAFDWLDSALRRDPALAALPLSESGIDSLRLVELQLELEAHLEPLVGGEVVDRINGMALQRWTCGEVTALSRGASDGDAAQIRRLAERLLGQDESARASEQSLMVRDSLLPLPDVVTGIERLSNTQPHPALLTGATGFLGPFLLVSLLEQSNEDIIAISRGDDDRHALRRIEDALKRAGLWAKAEENGFSARMTAWRGDLAQPELGLSPNRPDVIASTSFDIYHNAAQVDYVRTYDALRKPNVEGVRNLLSLAMTGAPKRFHHVSSTFIFGWTTAPLLNEDDGNAAMSGLDFGYSQSKWVAEQLVRRAAHAGLPTTIFRPSLISVSSTMHGDVHDVAARILAFMIRYGVAVDTPNQISLVPVDTLAHNLVRTARRDPPPGAAFHLTADRYYSLPDLTRQIGEDFGYAFEYVDIPTFVDRLNRFARPSDPVFPLRDFLNRAAPFIAKMSMKRYDNRHYQEARASDPLAWPDPSLSEIARRMVGFLDCQGWLPSAHVSAPSEKV